MPLRRNPVFVALDASTVSSGVQPDKHPAAAVLWGSAANVTFADGRVERRVPPLLMFAPANGKVRGLSQQFSTTGSRYVWAVSGGRVVRWLPGGQPETILDNQPWQDNADSGLGGNSQVRATFWDFVHYGDWTIINNGIGQAQLYKPGVSLGAYADSPSGVLGFMKKLDYMIAIGYGGRGTAVGWSDAGQIETWTPAESNLAGDLSIDDLETPIRSYSTLGQTITLYSENQMAVLTYIGSPYIFGQRTVFRGIGAVGKFAVASDGNVNVGVSRQGCWWTDGTTYKYIDKGFLSIHLRDNVNWDQQSKIYTLRNDYTGCFEFFFPLNGSMSVNEGWSWDPATGGWSPIPAFEFKTERKLFNNVVVGTIDGQVQLDQSGPMLPAGLVLNSKPILPAFDGTAYGAAHVASRVDEIELLCKNAVGVQMRIGSSNDSLTNFTWSKWQDVSAQQGTYKVESVPDGVYWQLQFQSVITNWQLDLQGFMLYGVTTGTKASKQ